VSRFWATSSTKRASWRPGESFSPPTDWRVAACAGVSDVGTPSANSRTTCGREMPDEVERDAPMMSLVNMPCTSVPAALAWAAAKPEPYSPCSSPATAMNTIVASKWRVAIARAISSTAITPEASSSAPGASQVALMGSVQIES
jgi:hypothetical protein